MRITFNPSPLVWLEKYTFILDSKEIKSEKPVTDYLAGFEGKLYPKLKTSWASLKQFSLIPESITKLVLNKTTGVSKTSHYLTARVLHIFQKEKMALEYYRSSLQAKGECLINGIDICLSANISLKKIYADTYQGLAYQSGQLNRTR